MNGLNPSRPVRVALQDQRLRTIRLRSPHVAQDSAFSGAIGNLVDQVALKYRLSHGKTSREGNTVLQRNEHRPGTILFYRSTAEELTEVSERCHNVY